jgi:hypothetical protein
MSTVDEETEYDNYAAVETKRVSEEQVMEKLEQSYKQSQSTPQASSDDEEDDALSYFSKLAEM